MSQSIDTPTLPDLPVIELGEHLRGMIPHIRQALEKGEAHEAHLRELVEKQRAENTRMRRALGMIDPDYVHPNNSSGKRKQKGQTHVGVTRANGTATGFGISVERAIDLAEAAISFMEKNKVEFITQPDLMTALGWDQGKVSSAFRYWRDQGLFRNAGKEKHGRRDRYAIMDKDVLKQVKQQIGRN